MKKIASRHLNVDFKIFQVKSITVCNARLHAQFMTFTLIGLCQLKLKGPVVFTARLSEVLRIEVLCASVCLLRQFPFQSVLVHSAQNRRPVVPLVEHRTFVREIAGSNRRSDQHLGS